MQVEIVKKVDSDPRGSVRLPRIARDRLGPARDRSNLHARASASRQSSGMRTTATGFATASSADPVLFRSKRKYPRYDCRTPFAPATTEILCVPGFQTDATSGIVRFHLS